MTRQSIAKDLGKLGSNANQIAKYCNQHQYDAPNYIEIKARSF